MLVCFVLYGRHYSKHGDYCYVIDNPVDKSAAFAVPVAVVLFGETAPTFITPPPVASVMAGPSAEEAALGVDESEDQTPAATQSRFRWHWEQDGGSFEPYTDAVNTHVERAFDESKRSGKNVVRTPAIRRYNDDRPQQYDIDFGRQLQINAATTYVRRIQRRAVDVLLTGRESWCYLSESGAWRRFDTMAQGPIRAAYTAYITGAGPSEVTIMFPGSPDAYKLNFVDNTQINTRTGARRGISLRE